MSSNVEKLVIGLAGAVGFALLAFAREHGQGETEPAPPPQPTEPPPSDPVVAVALQELSRWGGRPETDPVMRSTLQEYWQAAGEDPNAFAPGWETLKPWSAAFVSYVANKGAPGSLFPNAAHWRYLRRGLGSVKTGQYKTLDPNTPVRVGDIIVRTRVPGDRKTLQNVANTAFHPSHGDIVVGTFQDFVRVVGGNLKNSVRSEDYLAAQNVIADPRVIGIMRRREVANV